MGIGLSKEIDLCELCSTFHDKYGYNGWGWTYCKICNKCILNEDVHFRDTSAKMYDHCHYCNKHHHWHLNPCYKCKECVSSKHFHCDKCDNMIKHIHCDKCVVSIDHCHKCGFVEGKTFHCTKCTKCHKVQKNQFFCEICKKCVPEDYKHTLNH